MKDDRLEIKGEGRLRRMERARKTFNKFKRKKGVILLLLFFSCVLQAQDITGKWYAYANMKRVKLRLIYDIQKTSGGYAATLQIPDQSEESYTALPFYAMTTGGQVDPEENIREPLFPNLLRMQNLPSLISGPDRKSFRTK